MINKINKALATVQGVYIYYQLFSLSDVNILPGIRRLSST